MLSWPRFQEFLATDSEVRVRFRALPDLLRSSGSGTGSTQPREYNWGATGRKSSASGLENRDNGSRDPQRWQRDTLYLQKLALTSPTSGGLPVGRVRSRTKATEFLHSLCRSFYPFLSFFTDPIFVFSLPACIPPTFFSPLSPLMHHFFSPFYVRVRPISLSLSSPHSSPFSVPPMLIMRLRLVLTAWTKWVCVHSYWYLSAWK
jgi:hypothetical protein